MYCRTFRWIGFDPQQRYASLAQVASVLRECLVRASIYSAAAVGLFMASATALGQAEQEAPITVRGPSGEHPHWAFRPLTGPQPPPVRDTAWPLTIIDPFVLAAQEQRGLQPVGLADKPALLRRATFDLIGLPPRPDELAAFLADDSPGAFAAVVERLLASGHYGERWGRHWLDVVRYADTAGNPPDVPVPQAWRYRNYVIDSFANDKPFNRFVEEQVAGDLLPAKDETHRNEQTIATGFLAIHRRFGGTPESADHLEIEDLVDSLGRSFLGLSLACARCHDHKFDDIPARDYYALYGIFSSTRFPFPGAEGNNQQSGLPPLAGGGDAYAVNDGTPADAKLQLGGDPGSLDQEIPRGFLHVFGGLTLPADCRNSGRLELARWLTDPAVCPLVPRVIVNRVWQQHFGRGLVATAGDFGVRGEPPSHPELLDYLASRFVAEGWSIKSLHRWIMLSRTWQLASYDRPQQQQQDPGAVWLWRQRARRLDAEAIRDALLAVSGDLDHQPGGEHPFPPMADWKFSQHAPFSAVYETNLRSVYLMQQRIQRHPYLALFDGSDPNASTALRTAATTPLQALFFMNDSFVHRQADHLAARLLAAANNDRERLALAYRLLFCRPAEADEIAACLEYLTESRGQDATATSRSTEDETRVWSGLARAWLASNEFVMID